MKDSIASWLFNGGRIIQIHWFILEISKFEVGHIIWTVFWPMLKKKRFWFFSTSWIWLSHQNDKIDHIFNEYCKMDKNYVKSWWFRCPWYPETWYVWFLSIRSVLGERVQWQECTRWAMWQVYSQLESRIYDWSIIVMSCVLGQAGGNTNIVCSDSWKSRCSVEVPGE